jgi:hypothetical protein
VDDLGVRAVPLGDLVADQVGLHGVGVRAAQENPRVLADDLVEGVLHHAAEGAVDPLDLPVGGADDDEVVRLRGDERKLARLGLALPQRLLGLAPGRDVLDGADDPGRAPVGPASTDFERTYTQRQSPVRARTRYSGSMNDAMPLSCDSVRFRYRGRSSGWMSDCQTSSVEGIRACS